MVGGLGVALSSLSATRCSFKAPDNSHILCQGTTPTSRVGEGQNLKGYCLNLTIVITFKNTNSSYGHFLTTRKRTVSIIVPWRQKEATKQSLKGVIRGCILSSGAPSPSLSLHCLGQERCMGETRCRQPTAPAHRPLNTMAHSHTLPTAP